MEQQLHCMNPDALKKRVLSISVSWSLTSLSVVLNSVIASLEKSFTPSSTAARKLFHMLNSSRYLQV